MSEYKVEAYFLSRDTIKRSFGSQDPAILTRTLKDDSSIIADYDERFSGKTLAQAVADLVNGKADKKHPFSFHYAFAAWAIIAAVADGRPKKPLIGYPFVSLYDFCELLEEETDYHGLLKMFQSLNGYSTQYTLPIGVQIENAMPCIAYVENQDLPLLVSEAKRMKKDIKNEQDWTWDIEEPDDIMPILNWLAEAQTKQQSLCLVMEGDL